MSDTNLSIILSGLFTKFKGFDIDNKTDFSGLTNKICDVKSTTKYLKCEFVEIYMNYEGGPVAARGLYYKTKLTTLIKVDEFAFEEYPIYALGHDYYLCFTKVTDSGIDNYEWVLTDDLNSDTIGNPAGGFIDSNSVHLLATSSPYFSYMTGFKEKKKIIYPQEVTWDGIIENANKLKFTPFKQCNDDYIAWPVRTKEIDADPMSGYVPPLIIGPGNDDDIDPPVYNLISPDTPTNFGSGTSKRAQSYDGYFRVRVSYGSFSGYYYNDEYSKTSTNDGNQYPIYRRYLENDYDEPACLQVVDVNNFGKRLALCMPERSGAEKINAIFNMSAFDMKDVINLQDNQGGYWLGNPPSYNMMASVGGAPLTVWELAKTEAEANSIDANRLH